jgi:hypothetical protein
MELSAMELAALIRFHVNDCNGIDAARLAELADSYAAARTREASQQPRRVA